MATTDFQPRSKDASPCTKAAPFRTFAVLSHALFAEPESSPSNHGHVSLLVQRPDVNERHIVARAHFSVQHGMHGSGWRRNPERGTIDQICVMSSAAIRAVTGGDDRDAWAAAGDQIFMHFDLAKRNLDVGDRLLVGAHADGVVLQVTEKLHKGCAKFSTRFGPDALKAMNCPQGREIRARGIYFCVVRDGVMAEGDRIVKVPPNFPDTSS